MQTITITTPYVVNQLNVTSAEIIMPMFAKFAEIAQKAQAATGKNDKFETVLQRKRLVAQCTLIAGTTRIPLTDSLLMQMPIPVAKLLIPKISADDPDLKSGEIVTAGDGVSTPILYKLGTPIKAGDDKIIEEIEFFAKTYGEVEDVLAGDSLMEQAIALIASVAKPIGLLKMPSWGVDQITLADGLFIMNKILPNFSE